MEDKKCSSCACHDASSGCGRCGDNRMGFGGHHNHLTRGILYLIVMLFVFWIGLGLGELKGYLRYAPIDSGYYNIYPPWMMRQNNTNKSSGMMQTPSSYDTNATQSPIPGIGR